MLKMKGMRFPKELILVCIRWYAAYALSYRNLEEMMQERGVSVDHSTVNRWAIRFLPLLEKNLPSAQTARGRKLADGRNLYQGARAMEVLVPGG